ncbi:helicase-associated domain-containing protein [Actinomycetes bacterium KLBMP 9759]
MPTTLVEWLRAQPDEMLATLMRLRPDLVVPPPTDFGKLAARADVRASVSRSCDDLDTVSLVVLEALVIAGADSAPVPRAEVARLLGPDMSPEALSAALSALSERALVWGPDDELAIVPAARDVVPRYPGGLGRPAVGPAASSALPALLAAVTPEERRVLETLAAGPPMGRSRGGTDPSGPVGTLVAKGLLLRVDNETVELPRQVAFALRGDRPMGNLAITPPELGQRDRGADVVDRTAGGAALTLIRQVELLIAHWGENPPPVLRSGGLGVRELRRAAKEMETDESTAALVIEVVVAADLVGAGDGIAPEWMPTTSADVWLAGGPEVRWSLLARSWLDLPRLPGLVGRKDDTGRPIAALSDGVRRPLAPRDRRRILAGLAELPPGTAVGSVSGLAELMAWRAPRRGGRLRDEFVSWVLAEATAFGIAALDAISTPGRALLSDQSGLVAALRATLPEAVDQVLLQADLTAVAPGPLEPELARELGLLADVESAGGATVYRFTEATIRRGLDAGRSASDVHELLAKRSATPVPQGLTYLVDDVARRHGRLRGGAATSFLRSDDEVLIAEVMAHPEAASLELRRIAPTVVVSPVPLVEVLDALRAAGFSPAAEDTGGAVLDLSSRGRRTSPRRQAKERNAAPEFSERQLAGMIKRMRGGDTLAGIRRNAAEFASGSTLELLRKAVAEGREVWIGFVDGHGVSSERVLRPVRVGGGLVEGHDSLDGELHQVQLHRITSIALVEN